MRIIALLPLLTGLTPGIALPGVVQRTSYLQTLRHIDARGDSRTIITDLQTGNTFVPGETNAARTIYSIVSLLCVTVLALILGLRAKTLNNNAFRKCNFTSIIIYILFFFAISYILTATIVETGQGLSTHLLCYSAAIICLVFYTGNKLAIYIFLLERTRVVRAPFTTRFKDWIWVSGMTVIIGGFGTIAVVGYISPVVDLSKIDGRCRIGLPPKVSFPLLSFDVGINFALTGIFIYLLKPVLASSRNRTLSGVRSMFDRRIPFSLNWRTRVTGAPEVPTPQQRAVNSIIKTLLWKSMWGSILIMLPTVANMAQFYIMRGRELGWICLTICTLDVTWGVVIINWLTMSSTKAEENLTQSIKTIRDGPESVY